MQHRASSAGPVQCMTPPQLGKQRVVPVAWRNPQSPKAPPHPAKQRIPSSLELPLACHVFFSKHRGFDETSGFPQKWMKKHCATSRGVSFCLNKDTLETFFYLSLLFILDYQVKLMWCVKSKPQGAIWASPDLNSVHPTSSHECSSWPSQLWATVCTTVKSW